MRQGLYFKSKNIPLNRQYLARSKKIKPVKSYFSACPNISECYLFFARFTAAAMVILL
jgi:hypothetical protein